MELLERDHVLLSLNTVGEPILVGVFSESEKKLQSLTGEVFFFVGEKGDRIFTVSEGEEDSKLTEWSYPSLEKIETYRFPLFSFEDPVAFEMVVGKQRNIAYVTKILGHRSVRVLDLTTKTFITLRGTTATSMRSKVVCLNVSVFETYDLETKTSSDIATRETELFQSRVFIFSSVFGRYLFLSYLYSSPTSPVRHKTLLLDTATHQYWKMEIHSLSQPVEVGYDTFALITEISVDERSVSVLNTRGQILRHIPTRCPNLICIPVRSGGYFIGVEDECIKIYDSSFSLVTERRTTLDSGSSFCYLPPTAESDKSFKEKLVSLLQEVPKDLALLVAGFF